MDEIYVKMMWRGWFIRAVNKPLYLRCDFFLKMSETALRIFFGGETRPLKKFSGQFLT